MTDIIGDAELPGVYATQDSTRSVSSSRITSSKVGLVGEGDLAAGTASANQVYTVTTVPQAYRLFGNSPLTAALEDAIQNGAYPIYAVACAMSQVSNEDITSFGSSSGTVANAPMTERDSLVTFTLDGATQTKFRVFSDPTAEAPASDEVYYNPVTGEFQFSQIPSASATVSYSYPDYTNGLRTLAEAEVQMDFIGVLAENPALHSALDSHMDTRASQFSPSIGVIGARSYISDTATYTNPLDTSRVQLAYPPRNGAGHNLVGAYVGMRARTGLSRSGMRQRLVGQSSLPRNLTASEKRDLDAQNVLVFETVRGTVRTMNDPTCVRSDNVVESEMANGFSRLAIDYITDRVFEVADPFIGELHNQAARNALTDIITREIDDLKQSNAVINYVVLVERESNDTARVDVGVQTAKPLRNIFANIISGDVLAGFGAETSAGNEEPEGEGDEEQAA